MDQKVVYGLLALLTKTTPVDKCKSLPPKVVNHKDFIQSCHPCEESIRDGGFTFQTLYEMEANLPNTLPRKK
jgi:hypothetical protein